MNYRVHLKTKFADLDLREVLQSSPEVLLGVSTDAAATLASLKIGTVYDLALSTLFANAARVVRAASDSESVLLRHGVAPSDLLAHAQQGQPLSQVPNQPISVLVGIGQAREAELATTLGAKSVRDLAFWPPYLVAKGLLVEAYAPEKTAGYDKEAPRELIPKSGEYATQKVLYSSTVLIESKPSQTKQWDGGIIDITALDQIGFSDVAFGAVLTFAQTWSPKSVALGQLLHSLPLAPGESTKLTVVDWTRRVAASTTEEISQSELLENAMNQSTAIYEVTSAVAREFQKGSSISGSVSTSASIGGVGLPIIGVAAGSASANASGAATYTVSSGERSIVAQSIQNIASHTKQNSTFSRSKRAAIVSEVSESESETINTRSVTNYNHMHALSIQYYEVVQIYETAVKLNRIERCIFIPMRLVNFRKEQIIRKYLSILIQRALDRETRNLLLQYRNSVVMEFAFDRFATADLERLSNELSAAPPLPGDVNPGRTAPGPFAMPDNTEKRILVTSLLGQVRALKRSAQASNEVALRKRVLESFDRANQGAFSLDRGALIKNVAWQEETGIWRVTIRQKDGDTIVLTSSGNTSVSPPAAHPQLVTPIKLDQTATIYVSLKAQANSNPSDFGVFPLQLLIEHRGTHWFDLSFVASRGLSEELAVLHFHPPVDPEDISDRLMEDQLYYSQQIWLRADRQSLIMQLAGFEYDFGGGRKVRVIDYLEPAPVTVAGNYLAFRFTYEDDPVWKEWKENQLRAAKPDVDLLPIPTGGVFAEAVLGEFNSAEKLDATRFWRWQESPIPFAAPEIAALEAGKHGRVKAPTPGALPESPLKIQDLPALPSLPNSDNLLKALITSKIFNDMSGAEITSQLLAASLKAAQEGDQGAPRHSGAGPSADGKPALLQPADLAAGKPSDSHHAARTLHMGDRWQDN